MIMKYVSNKYFYEDLKKRLIKDIDVIISENNELKLTLFFQEQMCNISTFNRDLLPQLRAFPDLEIKEVLSGIAREVDLEKHDVYQIIFNGLMLIYDQKREKFYLLDISQALRRPTGDSNVEAQNIIGGRDGFTENYKDNISLLRSRLKNSNLLIEEFKIGKRSKTWVGLLYIEDIHSKEKREELIENGVQGIVEREVIVDGVVKNDVVIIGNKYSGEYDNIKKNEKDGAVNGRISVHYIKGKARTYEHGRRLVPQQVGRSS